MSSRKTYLAAAAAVMVVTAAAACSGADAGASGGKSTSAGSSNLTLAIVPSINNSPAYIAQYDGFFAQQGLHVTIKTIPSASAVITDELKGTVDISAGSYQPFITGEAAGQKFRILAEGSTVPSEEHALLTPPHSPITTMKQLAGATIGVPATNSISTLLVDEALQENGIKPSEVHYEIDPGGFPTMAAHLHAGAWDAAFLSEPFASEAEEQYGDVPLANLGTGAAAQLPISGYFVTRQWAQQHPAEAAAFTRAIGKAQRIADSDPVALRKAAEKSSHVPTMTADLMELPDFPVGPVNKTSIQRLAEAMLRFGQLSSKDAAEVHDGSLVGAMVQSP